MTLNKFASKALDDDHISHGFFGREGGFSLGIYESLNAGHGSNDDQNHVRANRAAIANNLAVPSENLLSVYQIHSNEVVIVETPWKRESAPKADAMVTRQTGIGLGIVTADCVPILFADSQARVIGAAHAGWKGAFAGVIENTIDHMEQIGANRSSICAAIGPAIHQKSYEVDSSFYKRFLEADRQYDAYFKEGRADHFQFDLIAFVKNKLIRSGVRTIDLINIDTYSNEGQFFSFRRTTHKGESDYGRQLSVIALSCKD